jgi:chemotaxis signal transduction protein
MTAPAPAPAPAAALGGYLRFVAAGRHFAVPLAQIERAALTTSLTRLPPRAGRPPWWRGVAIIDGAGVPVLHLAGVLGLGAHAPGGALVFCRAGDDLLALECEAAHGLLPAVTKLEPRVTETFAEAATCCAGTLRAADAPVLLLRPEALLAGARRDAIALGLADATPVIEQLASLRDQEATLANAPTAAGYHRLADAYAKHGLNEDTARARKRAGEVARFAAAGVAEGVLYAGAYNARALLELLHMLHTTAQSGELRLRAAEDRPGARFVFQQGRITAAEHPSTAPGEASLRRALAEPAGRFEFGPPGRNAPTRGALAADSVLTEFFAQLG